MQVALGPMELMEWQGLIKVFPACHVPACCWNAARFRQMHGPSNPNPELKKSELSIYAIEALERERDEARHLC